MPELNYQSPKKTWRYYFTFSAEERRRFWTDVVGALTFRLLKDRAIDWILAPFYLIGWKLGGAFVAMFIFGEAVSDSKPETPADSAAMATRAAAQPRPDSSYWGPSPGATSSTGYSYSGSSYSGRSDRYMSIDEARTLDNQAAAQRQTAEAQQRQREMSQARAQIQQPSYATSTARSIPAYTPAPSRSTPASAARTTTTYTPPRTTQTSTARATQTYTPPRPTYTPPKPAYTPPRPTPTSTRR